MIERPDLEDEKEEQVPVGQCACCEAEIMSWDEHYDIEGILVHDDCVLYYLKQFKKYAS